MSASLNGWMVEVKWSFSWGRSRVRRPRIWLPTDALAAHPWQRTRPYLHGEWVSLPSQGPLFGYGTGAGSPCLATARSACPPSLEGPSLPSTSLPAPPLCIEGYLYRWDEEHTCLRSESRYWARWSHDRHRTFWTTFFRFHRTVAHYGESGNSALQARSANGSKLPPPTWIHLLGPDVSSRPTCIKPDTRYYWQGH